MGKSKKQQTDGVTVRQLIEALGVPVVAVETGACVGVIYIWRAETRNPSWSNLSKLKALAAKHGRNLITPEVK